MMDKLTPKQQAFCEFYIESGNKTEAAIKAGYMRSGKDKKSIQRKVTRFAMDNYTDERTVYRNLAEARVLFAKERGLRIL